VTALALVAGGLALIAATPAERGDGMDAPRADSAGTTTTVGQGSGTTLPDSGPVEGALRAAPPSSEAQPVPEPPVSVEADQGDEAGAEPVAEPGTTLARSPQVTSVPEPAADGLVGVIDGIAGLPAGGAGSVGSNDPANSDSANSDYLPPRRGAPSQVGPTLPPQPPETILPPNSGTGRRVVYSNSRQRIWAVEADGTVVKTHRVSGKQGIPYAGTYSVWSRSMYTYAVQNPSIRWRYMVRFAHTPRGGNVGFHEIPTQCNAQGSCWRLQTDAQLGTPLSGGCVRQSTLDAVWMWNWAGIGTKVVVLP
jgi:lipoprotein-anchoring transpeptidase ErfK/SrfK